MPRLTSIQYLAIHTVLHAFWIDEHGHPLQFLSPEDQWLLHDYFRLSEDLTDEQLLEHRAQISTKRPLLPAAAGRVIKKIGRQQFTVAHPTRGQRDPRTPVIYPLVRPSIDYDKFTKALLRLAASQLPGPEAPDEPPPPPPATPR